MKTKAAHFILPVLTVLLAACNLDTLPFDSIVYNPDEPIIRIEKDLAFYTNGIHSRYRSVHYGTYATAEELMYDGFNAVNGYGNVYGALHRCDDAFTSSDSYVQAYWTGLYTAIKDYNILIDALDDERNVLPGLETQSRLAQGYACFYRAEAYLQLVRHFAPAYDATSAEDTPGVPIVLHYDLDARPARSSVAAVYAQIRSDLDAAREKLGGVSGAISSNVPTVDAVRALSARYCLDVQDYAQAASFADTLTQRVGLYTLSNGYTAMEAEYRNDAGTESILQMTATKSEMPPANDAYTNMSNDEQYGYVFNPLYLPSAKLVASYGATDLRGSLWLSASDYYSRVNGSFHKGEFRVFVKYFGNPSLYSGIPNAAQAVKPYMIGEQFLIAAEAYAKSGNPGMAKARLNALQKARGATETTGSMANVKAEWFRETAGEGLRMSCLKRWKEGFEARAGQNGALAASLLMTGDTYDGRSMKGDDYHLTWPIPAYEMKVNPRLVQNDGYGKE